MVNKVTLIGRVGKDAEAKHFDNGSKVVNFSLATSENYKDKAGSWQEKTEWHDIQTWGKMADKAESLEKGTLIYLEGKLTTRSWEDKEGQKRRKTEVSANYFRVLSRSENTNSSQPAQNNPDPSNADGPDDLPF